MSVDRRGKNKCFWKINEYAYQNNVTFWRAGCEAGDRPLTLKCGELRGTESIHQSSRMRANAQRDGRCAEYRWRPLFNAAKVG